MAEGLVTAGETMRAAGGDLGRRHWTPSRIESLYELAFFRVFLCWETCLESLFYRSLCGYASQVGQEVLLTGRHFKSLRTAEAAVLGNKKYLLWHSPKDVIARCKGYFRSGAGYNAVQESVLTSHQTRLEQIVAIRHRTAHHQTDVVAQCPMSTNCRSSNTGSHSVRWQSIGNWQSR